MVKLIPDKKVSSDKYLISINWILHKVVREDDTLSHALVLPLVLNKYVLHQAHNVLCHNGTARTYQCLKRLYYGKGLHKDVIVYVKHCIKCKQQNLHPQHYAQLHFEVPSVPMQFIAMDLIGKFKPSP